MLTSSDTGILLKLTNASATVSSPTQNLLGNRGIKVLADVTAISGTSPTLVVHIQWYDTATAQWIDELLSVVISAVGLTVLTVAPGIASVANVSLDDIMPQEYRVEAVIGGTSPSVTATFTAQLLS